MQKIKMRDYPRIFVLGAGREGDRRAFVVISEQTELATQFTLGCIKGDLVLS